LAAGGADIVIIDDPQTPGLIPLIIKDFPEFKPIYLSHREVRKDLAECVGSTQEQVSRWIWDFVKEADDFTNHPPQKSVPNNDTFNVIGLMPACPNKPLGPWDLRFRHHNLHNLCNERNMQNHLLYPGREYITQIVRFVRSKGIPDVIESYPKWCDRIISDDTEWLLPQLLIDPDAKIALAETADLRQPSRYAESAEAVVVVRIGPSDQSGSTSKINFLQTNLTYHPSFEVKVSGVLQHGKPVVATRAGGIRLQIEQGKPGLLVEVGDTDSVASPLFNLPPDKDLYTKIIKYAKAIASNEVGTVGNAACWLYLT
ncbi:hypothetical protein HOY82DRAFT_486841, partial [Tuber indicum]